VLDRLSNANLKVAPKKCHFFQKQVKFLGHLVSGEGISTDPAKVDSVRNWPPLKTVHDVRSFLGTCSYYRRFIPSFSDTARPLNKLTEKTAKFVWTDECESSFNSLKDKLTQAPILAYPCIQSPVFGKSGISWVLHLNWHWTTYQAQHLVGLYGTQIRLQKQLCRQYTIYTSSNEDLIKQTPSVAQK
jgi:hypothetical protein